MGSHCCRNDYPWQNYRIHMIRHDCARFCRAFVSRAPHMIFPSAGSTADALCCPFLLDSWHARSDHFSQNVCRRTRVFYCVSCPILFPSFSSNFCRQSFPECSTNKYASPPAKPQSRTRAPTFEHDVPYSLPLPPQNETQPICPCVSLVYMPLYMPHTVYYCQPFFPQLLLFPPQSLVFCLKKKNPENELFHVSSASAGRRRTWWAM